MSTEQPRTELRAVRSQDPTLSDRANAVLTDELRRVVGAEEVEVPVGRAHEERARHGGHSPVLVALVDNRLWAALGAFGVLVFGAILTLATGSWWFLGVAAALDVLGSAGVYASVVRITGEAEHLAPDVVALLEDEGVEDPDAVFGALIAEYSGARAPGAV